MQTLMIDELEAAQEISYPNHAIAQSATKFPAYLEMMMQHN